MTLSMQYGAMETMHWPQQKSGSFSEIRSSAVDPTSKLLHFAKLKITLKFLLAMRKNLD